MDKTYERRYIIRDKERNGERKKEETRGNAQW